MGALPSRYGGARPPPSITVPSGLKNTGELSAISTRKPWWWISRWCRRHNSTRLERSVGPPSAQWWMWWPSDHAGGRSQVPAKAQVRSLAIRALRIPAGMTFWGLPTSRGSDRPVLTRGDGEGGTTLSGDALGELDPGYQSPFAGHGAEESRTQLVIATGFARLWATLRVPVPARPASSSSTAPPASPVAETRTRRNETRAASAARSSSCGWRVQGAGLHTPRHGHRDPGVVRRPPAAPGQGGRDQPVRGRPARGGRQDRK